MLSLGPWEAAGGVWAGSDLGFDGCLQRPLWLILQNTPASIGAAERALGRICRNASKRRGSQGRGSVICFEGTLTRICLEIRCET